MSVDKSVIFLLGGPGCGKGTQAALVTKNHKVGYASAGDILRAEAANPDSPHGKEIQAIMAAGKLVPPELIVSSIKHAIETSEYKYFLMDGFPRTLLQDDAYRQVMPPATAVVILDAPDEVLIQRISIRGLTSGRVDDTADCVPKRLEGYRRDTQPVLERYAAEGKVITVDSNKPVESVQADFVGRLRAFWPDM